MRRGRRSRALLTAGIGLAVVVTASVTSGQWPVSKGLGKESSAPLGGRGRDAPISDQPVQERRPSFERPDAVGKADAVAVVRLEGGDVPADAARVLWLLIDRKIIGTERHTIERGDTVCTVYKRHTNFPGQCPRELVQLASRLNPKVTNRQGLQVDTPIVYPAAKFEEYEFSLRLAPKVRPEDEERLRELRTNWAWLIKRDEATSDGLVQLRLQGYELRVPVADANLTTLNEALLKIRGPNVLVGIISPGTAQRPFHNLPSLEDARRFIKRCNKRQVQAGEQGSLLRLLGAEGPCARTCVGGDLCPGTVVLVDAPVHRHPDLAGALVAPGGPIVSGAPATAADLYCELVDEFKDEDHHGTYMAGIIAAGGPKSRLLGVAPGSRLISLPWDRFNDEFTVKDQMEELNQGPMRVFVLATKWPLAASLRDPNGRLDGHPISKFVSRNYARLVAAAGQSKPSELGQEIGPKSDGPMNLGDQPNVIVVTACTQCDDTSASLPLWANYGSASTRYVHVAAPGSEVPSTASATAYAFQDGTSPAAALVGGLASAMIGCYPSLTDTPGKLKERLQVTSRPIVGPDATKVATGIVDARLALLDPGKDYARIVGRALEPITVEGWCQSSISVKDARNGTLLNGAGTPTRDVLRIVRVPGDRPEWVLYARSADAEAGVVVKIGPGTMGPFSGPPTARFSDLDKPLMRVKDIGNVSLRRVEDLLVHPAIKTITCP